MEEVLLVTGPMTLPLCGGRAFTTGNGKWLPPAPENWATVVSFLLAGEEVLPIPPAGYLEWGLQ